MKDNSEWSLDEFMRRKAKEAGGGSFFKVYYHGALVRTEWSRSKNDLINFLSRMEVKWDLLDPLV